MLLHGMDEGTGSWEELDCRQFADDARGDRTSLFLGGVACGGALAPASSRGLLASAGTGTLFLTFIEKLPRAARHVLCHLLASGRYTPVGETQPRPITCRIIVATRQPLATLARNFLVEWDVANTLGHITLRAENVISALEAQDFLKSHPGSLAAAS